LAVIELDRGHPACLIAPQDPRERDGHRRRRDHADDDQHAGKAHHINDQCVA
jgi:hypothetical protein